MTAERDMMRVPTPRELAAEYQREVEQAYDRGEPCQLHQAYWGRQIKSQFRRVYGWPR